MPEYEIECEVTTRYLVTVTAETQTEAENYLASTEVSDWDARQIGDNDINIWKVADNIA